MNYLTLLGITFTFLAIIVLLAYISTPKSKNRKSCTKCNEETEELPCDCKNNR